MSRYTMSDLKEAERLWEQMPIGEVAEKHPASESTIWRWKDKGLISPDGAQQRGPDKYPAQAVERADELWDAMPLREVAELIDVPKTVLGEWSAKGWISTDVDWTSKRAGRSVKVPTKIIVEAYHESDGTTQQDVADRFSITRRTVRRHLKKYRNGDL